MVFVRDVDGQHVLFFDNFLRHFRWMVDREADGPLCAVLGRSWGLCWRSGGGLGTCVGDLGPLLGLYWRSWHALGATVCDPGPLLEPMLAVLGRSGGLCGRSWASVGSPGWLLGPLLHGRSEAVLGREVAQTRTGKRSSEAGIAGLAGLAGLAGMDRIALKPSPDFFKR